LGNRSVCRLFRLASDALALRIGANEPMQPIVSAEVVCPHCGESFTLEVDTSQSEQDLIEDCSVCCRPIDLTICCRPGEVVSLAIGQ
jgi:hypothetical protein